MPRKRVLIDSCIFLSILYNEDSRGEAIKIVRSNERVISVITLSEVLSSCYKKSPEMSVKAKALIERAVGAENVIPVTKSIAEFAGKLKARYSSSFSLADSILLATALMADCEALATFDPEFEKVKEIEIVGL